MLVKAEIDNFYLFDNFKLDLSLSNKQMEQSKGYFYLEPALRDFPNFNCKRINIITGANASGKTSFGKIFLNLDKFLKDFNKKECIYQNIFDRTRKATIYLEYVSRELNLNRFLLMVKENGKIFMGTQKVKLGHMDSYESCMERLLALPFKLTDNLVKVVDEMDPINFMCRIGESFIEDASVRPKCVEKYAQILTTFLKALDPAIEFIDSTEGDKGKFIIKFFNGKTVELEDSKFSDNEFISTGAKLSTELASIFYFLFFGKSNSFFIDERLGNLDTEFERNILACMCSALTTDSQLFYTTHSTDLLNLNLPKFCYTIFRKDKTKNGFSIKAISADEYVENEDDLRLAIENDVFCNNPSVEGIHNLFDNYFKSLN